MKKKKIKKMYHRFELGDLTIKEKLSGYFKTKTLKDWMDDPEFATKIRALNPGFELEFY